MGKTLTVRRANSAVSYLQTHAAKQAQGLTQVGVGVGEYVCIFVGVMLLAFSITSANCSPKQPCRCVCMCV